MSAAIDRVHAALIEHRSKRDGDHWQCPAHEDGKPSLSVTEGDDGRALIHCHAECPPEDVLAALGLSMRDLFDDDDRPTQARSALAEYDYTDESGELLFQVVRFAPKDFRQRRPDATAADGWAWSIKDVRRVLYRLPAVIEAVREGRVVWVVEGEKDVHALESAGEVATCNAGGAGKWRDEYAEVLRGAEVVIVADKDEPGRKHAENVRASITGVAASVRVVEAAGGKDAADHLAAGYGIDAFVPVDRPSLGVPTDPAVRWPEPPRAEAFHGIAGEFVRLIEPHTEADPVALLVQFLAAVGSAFGASPHVLIEDDRHGAKLWTVIVGDTAHGRKGTSLGRVERIVQAADPTWAARRASNAGSGEVVVWSVRDGQTTVGKGGKEQTDPGEPDKRLFVAQSEFAGLLTVAGRDNSTLSPILRDAWDRSDLRTMSKTQPASATGAHIVVVGHITEAELRRQLSQTERANGFANRFLWICSRRSKELPRGGGRPDLEPLARRLATLIDFARSTGEVIHGPGFWAEYEPHYRELTSGQSGMVGAVLGRAAPYVHRLALVYALLDGVRVTERRHAVAALALWEYIERSARYIFGDSLGDPTADEILKALRDAATGYLTRTQIRDLFQRNRDIASPLAMLEQLGLAYCVKERGAGRAAECWFARTTTHTTDTTKAPLADPSVVSVVNVVAHAVPDGAHLEALTQ